MEPAPKITEPALRSRFFACAFSSIQKEHPNFLDLPIKKPEKYDGHPSHLHPAFFASFDWHSCVHSHWTITRILKLHPDVPQAAEAIQLIRLHLTKANIEKELDAGDYLINWELPYGYAWLLILAANLRTWDCDIGRELSEAIKNLENELKSLFYKWMKAVQEPERIGQHDNTAFALLLLSIYAKAVKDVAFEKESNQAALKFFEKDTCFQDPDPSECFLSPSLCVLHLMSRVMPADEFVKWVQGKNWQDVMNLEPVVGDASDPYKSHLIGLNFSRCWSYNTLSKLIPGAEAKFKDLALKHYYASLPQIPSGHWEADHWTATYALMANLSFCDQQTSQLY